VEQDQATPAIGTSPAPNYIIAMVANGYRSAQRRPVAGSRSTYEQGRLWPVQAAQRRGQGNTGSSKWGSWSFQDTQIILLQLHLYTILKNLCLK
jgi:hypothetical protein